MCSHTLSRAVPSALRGLTCAVCAASEPRGAIPSRAQRSRGISGNKKWEPAPAIPQRKKAIQIYLDGLYFYAGDDLRSHTLSRAVPSALRGLTSVFGMGTGGTPAVRSPTKLRRFRGVRAASRNPERSRGISNAKFLALALSLQLTPRKAAKLRARKLIAKS